MAPITNARVLFNEYPTGYPEPGKTVILDKSKAIDLENEPLNGGVLVKVLALSVDPYLRGMMNKEHHYRNPFQIGEPIFGGGISKIIRSENPKFSVGDHIYGIHPFVEYTVLKDLESHRKIDNSEGLSWSVYLGVCGMPGRTAYHGYKEFMQPYVKKGDTIFITTGAGAVGSLVIQLAKLDGLKVIASAGSEEKVKFVKECGADVAFDYKTTSTRDVLKEHGPINFYWDHVGGDSLDRALEAAAHFARFVICGLISGYNGQPQPVKNFGFILYKSLTVNGFIVGNLDAKHGASFLDFVPPKTARGEFKYKEDVRRGLEAVGQTLLDVQTGRNEGKAVIAVADD
ncbi:hypothetical protein ACEPAI_8661 [Sanghuangporus weigelae]